MTIESIAAPRTARISGTLHRRGYVQPVPVRDEKLPSEKTEASEVTDRHRDNGREDLKGGVR